nr:uncharacterized protein LOC109171394 isoform X2 [Ipomoea trifida]
MAPVFSRSAWRCAWHLIQNDLVHGWGVDMKLGYCAQGDRTKKVGVVDSEYIVHQSIQTLGGASQKKASKSQESIKRNPVDARSEVRLCIYSITCFHHLHSLVPRFFMLVSFGLSIQIAF